MDEIKEILVGMQSQMNGMQDQMNGMQDQMNGMQDQINGMQDQINGMQNSIEVLKEGQEQIKEDLTQEIRLVNQRLAVFQEEVTPKINILFDADATRKELLEIHDSEICEIKKEQFEHTLKIERLEHKVIGA